MAVPDYTTNQFGDITGTVAATLEKQALRHAQPHLVLQLGAKSMTLPKNDTKVLRARRAIPYAAATTALTEGVPPAATQLRYDEVDIPILQYGAYTPTTDHLVDLHTTPVLSDINILNSEQMAKTREALLWGAVQATTNLDYTGVGTNVITTGEEMTLAEQRRVVRTLNRNKAKKFTSIVKGGVNINTTPVEAAYLCFAHTDAEAQIRAMDGFRPVSQYGSQKPVHEMELGTVESVRYILSADLDPQLDSGVLLVTTPGNISAGTRADVYTAIYCGMDAYCALTLGGKGMFTPVVRNIGKPTDTDPLGQVGSVGWKTYCGEKVLNNDWIIALHHAVRD